MADFVGSLVVEKLGRSIVAPIKRQFNYLCCFNSNIESLRDEAMKLADARAGLQVQVDVTQRNGEMIIPEVETWLEKADIMIQVDLNGIEGDIINVTSGCLNMKSRYLLSRKARITTEAMEALRASTPIFPQGTSNEIDSRKEIEEKIMEDLRGGKVHKVAIYGMGGAGKTTMAKKIMNRSKEENLFDEVVMVVVSQQVDMLKIQSEIAESLGMRLDEETLSDRANKLYAQLKLGLMLREESLSARVRRFVARLKGPKKGILLILDDVWEGLNLEELGIPCKSDLGEGCTIVLTSRNMDVLSEMNAKPYEVNILSENEAWFLFREKIGTWIDDSDLLSIAKEIVQECKGLPLALTTVGTALRYEKNTHIWEDALHELKSSNSTDDREVYKQLKLSYEYLENQDARSLFLLCCLFPEDCDIPLEYLTMYGMGLGMFDGIMSVEEARNRVRTLFKTLKARFLLRDGCDENHVKMHDLVRDVAIIIASEEGRADLNLSLREESINCTWSSVYGEEINKLPIRLSFPSLRLLKIDNYYTEIEINTDPSFFQGMMELNVLSFRSISFRSLPETTQLLKNLRTLYLEECDSLETISMVGGLLSLEIFICNSCHMIEEFPAEIGGLKQLRILEIYNCRSLKRIAPGVISKFVQLEELIIVTSFGGWETKANEEQRENAAICELEPLSNLRRLEIEIENVTLAAEVICHPSEIVNYKIRFGGTRWESSELDGNGMIHKFKEEEITFGKWIKVIFGTLKEILIGYGNSSNVWCHQIPPAFFSQLEALEIYDSSRTKSLFSSLIAVNLVNLKELRISQCKEIVKVIEDDEETLCEKPHQLFPSLLCLYLEDLPKLQSFCSWRHDFQLPSLEKVWIKGCHFLGFFTMKNVLFRSLKKIVIRYCNNIGSLFLSSIVENLENLKILSIFRCKEMVEVIENDTEQHVLFPNMKVLEFHDLPKLQSFCNWRCDFQFPSLENVDIYSCPLLKKFSMGSISTPNLKRVEINSKLKVVGDLNGAIQLHFEANQFHQLNSNAKESTSAQATEADHKKGETEEEEIKEEINEKSWICKELSLKMCF